MNIEWLPIDVPAGTHAVIVRLTTPSGVTGLGEAGLPERNWQGSITAVADFLRACATPLRGADVSNLNATGDLIQRIGPVADGAVRAARSALDMAMYDIVGKLRGCPVHSVLGGAFRTEIELTTGLWLNDRVGTPAGISALRLRIGRDVGGLPHGIEPDAMRLVLAALDAVGPSVQVDIDAMQAFDNPALARAFIEGLFDRRFYTNVGLIQPLPVSDLVGHALLREALRIPLILDEAVTSADAMSTIVRMQAADRIVVNLDRVGGLREAMRVASLCEPAAIGVVAAGTALTAIGAAAVCHLAAVLHDTYPADINNFSASGIASGLELAGGRVVLGSAPGLGVDLDVAVSGMMQAVH